MFSHFLVVLSLFLSPLAFAAPGDKPAIQDAVQTLSRYPAGMMPVSEPTLSAIDTLHESGERQEIALLKHLAEFEAAKIQEASRKAILAIRDRQRILQRTAFAASLPNWPDMETAAAQFIDQTTGPEEARCVAYVDWILGESDVPVLQPANSGDAEQYLASGEPRKALAVLIGRETPAATTMMARAFEDLGEIHRALTLYWSLFLSGENAMLAVFQKHGIDPERFLLGLPHHPYYHTLIDTNTAQGWQWLKHHGDILTLTVLGEQLAANRNASESKQLLQQLEALNGQDRVTPLSVLALRELTLIRQRQAKKKSQSLPETPQNTIE